jgi:hypothetical protein
VDNSFEGCCCARQVTPEILPLSYKSRRHGRKDLLTAGVLARRGCQWIPLSHTGRAQLHEDRQFFLSPFIVGGAALVCSGPIFMLPVRRRRSAMQEEANETDATEERTDSSD